MAAVTEPRFSSPPSRRRWLAGGSVAVWIVALLGLALWSVDNEPATVPEQRDIGRAVPQLQTTAGVVFAAAGGPGRAVVLGELTFSRNCRVTPVRDGVVATRDVVVHVRAGAARVALEAIAAALPESYAADVSVLRAGTRLSLYADAGNFIAIDADAPADARAVTLRLSTGCRPQTEGKPGQDDPPVGPPPGVLDAVVAALGGAPAGAGSPGATPTSDGSAPQDGGTAVGPVSVRGVGCPGGGVAATYQVDALKTPTNLEERVRRALGAAEVVRADDDVAAYRTGSGSVVVERAGGDEARLSVSTAC
jgi:hypothetical protein